MLLRKLYERAEAIVIARHFARFPVASAGMVFLDIFAMLQLSHERSKCRIVGHNMTSTFASIEQRLAP